MVTDKMEYGLKRMTETDYVLKKLKKLGYGLKEMRWKKKSEGYNVIIVEVMLSNGVVMWCNLFCNQCFLLGILLSSSLQKHIYPLKHQWTNKSPKSTFTKL